MIGIMGALKEEVDLVCETLEEGEAVEKAGSQFYTGTLGGQRVTIVRCGVGKVNAAICTQILIDRFQCERILFAGVAGALLKGLDRGDVVISSHAVQFDIDLTAFGRRRGELADQDRLIEADAEMVKAATRAFDRMADPLDDPPSLMVGTIVSGDSFISDPKTIKWLQREFGAACTEMEGGAVAYTCRLNQIPFLIIRVISDRADDDAKGDFEAFLSRSSQLLYQLIAGTVKGLLP